MLGRGKDAQDNAPDALVNSPYLNQVNFSSIYSLMNHISSVKCVKYQKTNIQGADFDTFDYF